MVLEHRTLLGVPEQEAPHASSASSIKEGRLTWRLGCAIPSQGPFGK